ncbi:MAG: GIY-YIG nuclease family protein [Candidatus Polarisedimenticolaceae bacterium]|nr:GIY-YIG nuclease family protein [Candidatus Polarisedimenticolaceae bacterium]
MMRTKHQPTNQPGTYLLLLQLPEAQQVEVGSLGLLSLKAGWYLYSGSAFGPGGIKARCAHHRKISPRPRWHIDYLRLVAPLREIWFSHDPERREHQWAELVRERRGSQVPQPGFGSSDCDCETHLLYTKQRPSFDGFRRRAYRTVVDHAMIKRESL